MRNFQIVCLSVVLGALAVSGCKSKDAAHDKVTWPAQPSDGTPVAVEFISLDGAGDKLAANLRLFNFADKDIASVNMLLHYLDASGKELKTFPWGQTKRPVLVEKKDTAEITAGAFLPAETKTVKVDLEKVGFADGSSWASPKM